jgi:hypothetical protein
MRHAAVAALRGCPSLHEVGRTDARLTIRAGDTVAGPLANATPADAEPVRVEKDFNRSRDGDDFHVAISGAFLRPAIE